MGSDAACLRAPVGLALLTVFGRGRGGSRFGAVVRGWVGVGRRGSGGGAGPWGVEGWIGVGHGGVGLGLGWSVCGGMGGRSGDGCSLGALMRMRTVQTWLVSDVAWGVGKLMMIVVGRPGPVSEVSIGGGSLITE